MQMKTKIKKKYYLTWVKCFAQSNFLRVLTFKSKFQSIFTVTKKFCRNYLKIFIELANIRTSKMF